MKIVSLKLGQVYAISPVTFEPVYKHPLMDIFSGHSALKDEVKEWLHNTCKRPCTFEVGPYGAHLGSEELDEMTDEEMATCGYHIRFESDEDATLFQLRWL